MELRGLLKGSTFRYILWACLLLISLAAAIVAVLKYSSDENLAVQFSHFTIKKSLMHKRTEQSCNPSLQLPSAHVSRGHHLNYVNQLPYRERRHENESRRNKTAPCNVDVDKFRGSNGVYSMNPYNAIYMVFHLHDEVIQCDATLERGCVGQPQYVHSQYGDGQCIPICKNYDSESGKCGPSFMIIGAQKSATTSLFSFLTRHPSFQSPLRKESHFYHLPVSDEFYDSATRKREYLGFFPSCVACITGEATPEYSIFPRSAQKIREDWPNTRIIMITREPVSRAKSEYNMMQSSQWLEHIQPKFRHLVEMKTFHNEIMDNIDRLKNYSLIDTNQGTINLMASSILHPNYYHKFLERGMYASQIEEWLKYFERNQILVIRFEDLVDPMKQKCVLRQTLRFLGMQTDSQIMDFSYMMSLPVEFQGTTFAASTSPELERVMKDFYAPFNRRLNRLMRRDFHYTD